MQISCFRNFRSKKPGSSTLEAIAEYIRTDRSLAQITALYRKDGSKTIKEESCGGIRGYWVMERSADGRMAGRAGCFPLSRVRGQELPAPTNLQFTRMYRLLYNLMNILPSCQEGNYELRVGNY